MEANRLQKMNIASNILTAYYSNKNCFCTLNKREPSQDEKQEILERVISMFENLCTSYLDDIGNIAEEAK